MKNFHKNYSLRNEKYRKIPRDNVPSLRFLYTYIKMKKEYLQSE